MFEKISWHMFMDNMLHHMGFIYSGAFSESERSYENDYIKVIVFNKEIKSL